MEAKDYNENFQNFLNCRNKGYRNDSNLSVPIYSMKWIVCALRAVQGVITVFIGFTFLQILLLTLFQAHFIYAGCREEPRAKCESICIKDEPETSIGFDSYNCTVRAVVILPKSTVYEVSLPKVSPVFALAEKKIQELQLLPSYVRFEWISYDDKCDASYATISAMDGYGKNCAHVLFGPACDYALASVSRIAKYFRSEGTPLISVGGFTYNFEQKKTSCADEFYMLIRAGSLSFKTIGEFMLALLKQFNWNHTVFLLERDGQHKVAGLHTCHLMMSTLAHVLRESNITYSSFATDSGTGNMTEDLKREVGLDNASK